MKFWKQWGASALLGIALWTSASAASTSVEMLREMFAVPPTEWHQQLEANRRLLNDEFFTNVDKRVRWGIENNHVDDAFRFAMVGDFAAEIVRRPANYRIDLADLFFKAQNYVMTRQIVDNIIITSRSTETALRAQFLRGRLKEMERDLYGAYQDYTELAQKKYLASETWFKAGQISMFRGEISLAQEEFRKAASAGSQLAQIELQRIEQLNQADWSSLAPLPSRSSGDEVPAPRTSETRPPAQHQDPVTVATPTVDPLANARLALADGRIEEALSGYQALYSPDELEIAREYGAALYRHGDLEKAQAVFEQALAAHPKDSQLIRYQANTFERLYDRQGQKNDLKKAIEGYQEALKLEPSSTLLPWELQRAQQKI